MDTSSLSSGARVSVAQALRTVLAICPPRPHEPEPPRRPLSPEEILDWATQRRVRYFEP
jgi:hypothetical protein